MNPRLMLSLWRERWGKADRGNLKVPYVHGKVGQWYHALPRAAIWSVPGFSFFAVLACLALITMIVSIRLTFFGQVELAISFFCIALYIRRYAGTVLSLVLIGMAVIASARYLYWRLDATLIRDVSLHSILCFYLFVAECYLALFVFVGSIQSVWPLKRMREPLPANLDEWPTVDVFVLCGDQTYAAIKCTSMAALKLNWPRKKLKIYLIDGGQRDDLQALAGSIGGHYLTNNEGPANHAGFVNSAFLLSSGELIAIFESGQAPDRNFLTHATGWFLRDSSLGMAQTPHHFLGPTPSPNYLKVVSSLRIEQSCALVRRSIILGTGGLYEGQVNEKAHSALRLQASGYSSAYLGFGGPAPFSPVRQALLTVISQPEVSSTDEMFLVEHPFLGRTLVWKQRIISIQQALHFYYPVTQLIFFLAPVLYLLGWTQMIQSSPELFAAYAVPHFLLAYIARSRLQGKNRFTLTVDIRETVLAWYILIPVTLTLIQTELNQCLKRLFRGKANHCSYTNIVVRTKILPLHAPLVVLTYLTIFSLNLSGLISGVWELLFLVVSEWKTLVLYLLWTGYNLLLLMAVFAVAQEAKQVLTFTKLRRHMPAMIKFPSGRTVSCQTKNFPATLLALSLPMSVVADAASAVSISIFHGHRELEFSASIVAKHDRSLTVSVADSAHTDYQNFAIAVLSRASDWPKWLPSRDADHPLPRWVSNIFLASTIAILDFVMNLGKYLHWTRLDSWIQLWKKK